MKELNERLSNTNDLHVREIIREQIEEALQVYNKNKEEKVVLIEKRKEIKKIYKTFKKAIEERWMNGFEEGIQFATETYNKN